MENNKITKKNVPLLFVDISEMCNGEDSYNEHRRGSSFYRKSIITFTNDDKEYYPDIDDFEQYLGTWETNIYVISDDNVNWDEITELTRVKEVMKIIKTTEWIPVK